MTFDRTDYENFLDQATCELHDIESWLDWHSTNCPFSLPKEILRYAECTVAVLKEDIARYRRNL